MDRLQQPREENEAANFCPITLLVIRKFRARGYQFLNSFVLKILYLDHGLLDVE